ncbi:DUF2760 domain-containing protein [soil metagenome]
MATSHDPSPPSFFTRIALAIGSFFRILGDAAYAARVQGVDQPAAAAAPAPAPAPVAPPPAPSKPVPALKEATPEAALQLLGLLQREARLIDFVEEEVAAYSDAEIGGAARLVHEGCRKVLREHFTLAPAREEAEGSRIVLNEGFDAAAVRLTGNVVGAAPYRGTLSHRGWRVTEVRLPRLAPSHDAKILAAAEVEL